MDAAQSLHTLFAEEWDTTMEQEPTWASSLGDRRWNDRWPDRSLDAVSARHQHRLAVLERLATIDRGQLSAGDRLNYDLFRRQYEIAVEEQPFGWYRVPLNQRGGAQTADELGDSLRFETALDYEEWIARLHGLPAYLEQTAERMREGIRTGMLLPQVVMRRVPGQIEKQVVTDPAESPFTRPFRRFPAPLAEGEQRRLARAAEEAIETRVVPAYVEFGRFFREEYLPACPEPVGAWHLPEGEALYRFFVRAYTTTGMTPEEVHAVGLEEVARLRGQMEKVKKEAGFTGSLAEFFDFLRSDPQFRYSTAEELLAAYRAMAKRIDPHLVRLFRTLPRTPYGVEPIPAAIAPDTTTAYYEPPAADGSRAGTYYVNLYQPEARPTYEMMALSLHEAVPGHHLQIALATEQDDLPLFRRHASFTAYVEGWALYAESLGEEMELYDDPYSRFGRLTYDMWRAVRLVVDTGLHAFRWDRDRAIRYFMENAAKQELDVVNEIDRYIAWPGQALAYKIGELKIHALRARATQALGNGFDLRDFHDVLLRSGAVPLDVLERQVEESIGGVHSMIQAGKRAPRCRTATVREPAG